MEQYVITFVMNKHMKQLAAKKNHHINKMKLMNILKKPEKWCAIFCFYCITLLYSIGINTLITFL